MPALQMDVSPVFEDLYSNFRFDAQDVKQGFVFEGGSRSSKTWSIIQFIVIYCIHYAGKHKRITIAREKLTWLKATVLIDFIEILLMYDLYNPAHHNRTDNIYHLFGNHLTFIGLDEKQKLHGRKQNIFWLNEGIEAKYDDFKQMNQRTDELFILDYNPSETEHWIYDHVITRPDTKFFHSTQLDNPFLPEAIRREILSYEPTEENIANGTADENYWQIYGLGLRATPEGLIFPDWTFCKEMPRKRDRKITGFALDYGFSNDPSTLIEICLAGGQLWLDELFYEKGLTNVINPNKPDQPSIEQRFVELGIRKHIDPIIAESAEPKSNRELQNAGYNITPVLKRPDSVRAGINILKRYRVNVTERSLNIKKERNNYKWKFDFAENRYLNEPEDKWNHTIDSARYWALKYLVRPSDYQGKIITNKAALGF